MSFHKCVLMFFFFSFFFFFSVGTGTVHDKNLHEAPIPVAANIVGKEGQYKPICWAPNME